MATGTEPRDAALDILRAVRAGRPFDHALDTALPDLSDRDRRLAHEIAAGVLRERTMLDRRIATALAKPSKRLPDDVRDVLRIGVYQLSYLDRVPAYAAVTSAVELAKHECHVKYASLVNAVLRRVTRTDDTALQAASSATLAVRYSHPAWIVERWLQRWGAATTELVLRHNNTPPPIVIQPARWTASALRAALETAGVASEPGPLGFGFTIKTTRIQELPGYAEGGFIVQDSAQRRLVDYIGIREHSRVWDACASPGGKTATLAQSCTVVASDASRSRIGRLRDTLSRTAAHTPIVVADAGHPPFRTHSFDITVVDVPCSATGTLARHPDARWRLSSDRLKTLTGLQQHILDGAAESTPVDGLLVYLTCSVEPEENEQQVEGFLHRNRGFRRDNPDLSLLPGTDRADGGFGARMRRVT